MASLGKKYYVYALIDPKDFNIFYIGKGTRYRINEHVNLTKAGKISNGNKYLNRKIKSILNKGLNVISKKLFESEDEKFIFNKEKRLIKLIGLKNLCNSLSGGNGFSSDQMKELWSRNEFREKMMKKDYSWSRNNEKVKTQLNEARKLIPYKETGIKISKTRLERKLTFTVEARMKGSRAPKEIRKKLYKIYNNLGFEIVIKGRKETAEFINCSTGAVSSVLSGKRNSVFGYNICLIN